MQQTFEGHPVEVYDAVFSPDGKRLATASVDKTAKVWTFASGRELAALAGHANRIQRIAFSPNGGRLATASWEPKHKSMG